MTNKAQRILAEAKKQLGGGACEAIVGEIGALPDSPSTAAQGHYAAALLEALAKSHPGAEAAVMRPCGQRCFSGARGKVKELYAQSINLPDFLARLNEQGIGGGELRVEGGDVVGVYRKCYCGLVREAKGALPASYCHCSAGWFEGLFSAALNRPVQVDIAETILGGAEACTFVIHIG